jgi:hypothetical protein
MKSSNQKGKQMTNESTPAFVRVVGSGIVVECKVLEDLGDGRLRVVAPDVRNVPTQDNPNYLTNVFIVEPITAYRFVWAE